MKYQLYKDLANWKIFFVVFEIFLFIMLSFYVSGSIGATSGTDIGIREIYGDVLGFVFEDNIVSAQTGVFTCSEDVEGKICMEYLGEQACNDHCLSECFPGTREHFSECKLGTCYDDFEGTCQAGAPRFACEDNGGEWLDDPFENVLQCQEGCCVLGEKVLFGTEQRCTRKSEELGIQKEFRSDLRTELSCIVLAKTQEEGACVFPQSDDVVNACKFTTKSNCLNLDGEFSPGFLCSHPELNSNCVKQQTTGCFEGKDEVYWLDSCGNRENLYDSNKAKSWNEGKVLEKSQSCSLSSSGNPLGNQESCGNCNYLSGSICGTAISGKDNNALVGEFVCRDLSCMDESGDLRKSGESWCAYQSRIGIDEENNRAVDTPGSRHFRKICMDGDIRTEPCADFRNGICVESQTDVEFGSFSSAVCRINGWQQCFEYNTREVEKEELGELCSANPDCFVKHIAVGSDFNFKVCAPRVPPGLDLNRNPEGAQRLCSMASQTCTAVYVKKVDDAVWVSGAYGVINSDWECVANCECEEPLFIQQMNDWCMSLGDCGASVNYQGNLRESYKVSGAPELSEAYLEKIEKYSEVLNGQFIDAGNFGDYFGTLGIPNNLGQGQNPEGAQEFIDQSASISGMIGTTLMAASYFELGAVGAGTNYFSGYVSSISGLTTSTTTSVSLQTSVLGAYSSVFAGAVAGASIASLLIKWSGIGAGLPKGLAYALVGAAAVGGAIIGAQAAVATGLASSTGYVAVLGAAGPVGWIILVIVIVIIIVLKIVGIGETEEVIVSFSCKPWQPEIGGKNCRNCGSDDFPCSRYSCQSLGQTCDLINEGTSKQECVDLNPGDVASPMITSSEERLGKGFSLEGESRKGVRVRSTREDGCVGEYELIDFGLDLDEPAQCRVEFVHTDSFEEMSFDFGDNFFLKEHTTKIAVPSIDSLGAPGFDPDRRGEYKIFVRCQDKRGNRNVNEYVVEMCIRPGEDFTPVEISRGTPRIETVRFDSTEEDVTIYTSEPAECKWDSVDRDYSSMSTEFTCLNELEEQTVSGWTCNSVFPIIQEEELFYIRCRDQPWFSGSEREGDRNSNTESFEFPIRRSSENLKIDSIEPGEDEVVEFSTQPASVSLKVKTSGGVDGTAECKFSFGQSFITFFDTFSNEHEQIFQAFSPGRKNIQLECEDRAGNFAERVAEFKVEIDTEAPEVTRVYVQSGSLIVVTDEDSECSYQNSLEGRGEACAFNFEDGEKMAGFGITHSTSFNPGLPYYIKCRDIFGKTSGDCSIVVRSGEI